MGRLSATATFRIIGLAMLVWGAATLILLQTDHRDWALDHSLAEIVSWSDRRANNEITGSVDEPMAIAGAGVLVFSGLWFGLLIPFVFDRQKRKGMAMYDDDLEINEDGAGSPGPP